MAISEAEVEAAALAIWRETYRHDTLLEWRELKRGQMHQRRVMAAARAALQAAARARGEGE